MSSTKHIYKGRIVDLRLEPVELPNGKRIELEVIHHPGASAVVAIDDERQVVLIRQFRHAAGGYIWEIPAGTLDAGEDPRDCATRELTEETGLVAREITPLGSIVTTPGFCNERIYLFLARGLTTAEQKLDHDEVLTVERVPFHRALEMVARDEIQDAKSIAGLCRAAAWLDE